MTSNKLFNGQGYKIRKGCMLNSDENSPKLPILIVKANSHNTCTFFNSHRIQTHFIFDKLLKIKNISFLSFFFWEIKIWFVFNCNKSPSKLADFTKYCHKLMACDFMGHVMRNPIFWVFNQAEHKPVYAICSHRTKLEAGNFQSQYMYATKNNISQPAQSANLCLCFLDMLRTGFLMMQFLWCTNM